VRRAVGLLIGSVGEVGGCHVLPELILPVRGVTVGGGRRYQGLKEMLKPLALSCLVDG
jgi:hypothetical protein